jgi:hypothetical protein
LRLRALVATRRLIHIACHRVDAWDSTNDLAEPPAVTPLACENIGSIARMYFPWMRLNF